MDLNKFGYFLFGLSAFVALGGCEAPRFAGEPGSPAPAIVNSNNGPFWTNVSSFGAVPESVSSRGNEYCRSAFENTGKTYKASGYHPYALALNGYPIIGGGFFCTPQ